MLRARECNYEVYYKSPFNLSRGERGSIQRGDVVNPADHRTLLGTHYPPTIERVKSANYDNALLFYAKYRKLFPLRATRQWADITRGKSRRVAG